MGVYEEETGAWADVLEEGKKYRRDIFLTAAESYKLPEDKKYNQGLICCKLNGIGQEVKEVWVPEFGGCMDYDKEYTLIYKIEGGFLHIFIGNFIVERSIESVEFTLPGYKVGNKGNYEMVSTTTENVTVKTSIITVMEELGETIVSGQEIKPNTEYSTKFTFVADKGYSLAKLKKENIKVMGKEPKEFYYLVEEDAYYVRTDLDILHDGNTESRNIRKATCIQDGYTGNVSGNTASNELNYSQESNPDSAEKEVEIPAKNTTLIESATGIKYRVTKAGENGGCVEFLAPNNKKLKQITIPATVKIGSKAFTGISKKAKVTVPKRSYKKYSKILYKKGISKKAKIKKAKK